MGEWKPKTIEEARSWLKELQDSGQGNIRGPEIAKLLATLFSEMAELLYHALHDNPKAHSYLAFSFGNDKTPEFDFDVVLLKRGKHYPPRNMKEKIQNLDPSFMRGDDSEREGEGG